MKSIFTKVILVVAFFLVTNANSKAQNAYIPNYGDNDVYVINIATNMVTDIIPVGNTPIGVSVSPDGNMVYIANNGDTTVSVISTATNTVVATVIVGRNPWGIAVSPDNTSVYVANDSSNTVSVINTATNMVSATIPVGNLPIGLAITPDGRKVYVLNDIDSTVSVINTLTNTVSTVIHVGVGPFGVFASNNGMVYVANQYDNTVSVIKTATDMVTAIIPVGAGPYGLATTPNGNWLYVTNNGGNADSLSVVNTLTNMVTANVIVGPNPYNANVTADGSRVYVTNEFGMEVSVISTATNLVNNTIPVGTNPSALGNFIAPVCPPSPVITGLSSVCAGASVTLSIGTFYDSYQWNNGATTKSINVTTTGNYFVTVSNGGTCTAIRHHSVTFLPAPSPVITGTGISTYCNNLMPANLTVGNFSSYLWSTNQVTQSIVVLPNESGTYTVTVTRGNNCTGSASIVLSNACALPTPTGTTNISATGGRANWIQPSCVYGYTIRISKHNLNSWTNYVIAPNTHYAFSGLAHNTAYDWQIQTNCDVLQTNTSGFSAIQTFATAPRLENGETDNVTSSFNIYPNPANDRATITFVAGSEEVNSIRLMDVTGRVILSDNYTSVIGENQYQLNLSKVAKGIYSVVLQNGGGVLQGKIVVQ
jgi:YVTN family beta-propeller protein